MVDIFVRTITKWLLRLRYRITISGMEAVAAKGTRGILFLPNHPALIDPVILYVYMHGRFAPRGFADKDQVDRPLIRFFAQRWGVRTIPSMAKYGSAARSEIERVLDESIEGLRHGENLLLWPAGRVYRSHKENLSANSSVERMLQHCPDVRIALIRTRGLWGSGFSWASGREPKVLKVLAKGFLSLLASGIFFAPRRQVTIEFFEPEDLPRQADRNSFNRYLERYYNADALPNTYVPHTLWEKGGAVTLPEPTFPRPEGDPSSVPTATRQIVLDYLSEVAGISKLRDSDHLAFDLGMDSLARADVLLWLEREFGFAQVDADALRTVGDVMLAACGEFVHADAGTFKPVPPRWFSRTNRRRRLTIGQGESITEIFLNQALRAPSQIAIADQTSGVKSYRDIVIACLALKPAIERLSGDCVGIMMPASVGAGLLYLATLFAGKIPVMVNWTAGPRNTIESVNLVGANHILTTKVLIDKIGWHSMGLSGINDRFIFVEELARGFSHLAKLRAWLAGYLNWSSLRKAKVPRTAAIMFTSGSETSPKAVPLTHANIMANIRDVLSVATIRENDRLIGLLPPFHSFGLTVTILLPLCGGAHIVYHPNPMEAGMLAQLIKGYRVTVLIGTPRFLNGIVRVATEEQLSSLRLVVTGAERCSEEIYRSLKKGCENAVLLEGYGVTECSPIISLNDENNPRPFTIGKVLPSLEYLLVEPETGEPLKGMGTGILLVRGPSVFKGYLRYEGQPPFVEVQGKSWYSTGDLASVDEQGVLTFCGRLRRFVKLAGEMISLPAIEAVLEQHHPRDTDEGPVLAVEATADEQRPELVLFTTRDLDRETVNRQISDAGLSGLYRIRRVVKLKEIPVLGTGKTDYRALQKIVRDGG